MVAKLNRSSITPQRLFSEVAKPKIKRSVFPRNHFWSGTFPGDKLIPVFWDRVLPGDTMELKVNILIRYNTLIKPIQASQYCDIHFFFVPNRLTWVNFKKFMGEQDDPGDSIDFTMPTVPSTPTTGWSIGGNFDYLGFPPLTTGIEVTADVTRSLALIYKRWFRDQNLIDSSVVDTDNGPDDPTDYDTLFTRAKSKDYFTSALPTPQKGDPITISFGTEAPVTGVGKQTQTYSVSSQAVYETDGSGTTTYTSSANPFSDNFFFEMDPNNTGYPNLRADLSQSTGITVNAFRQYNAIQVFVERDNRSGTRYNEMTYSHFGVLSEDYRVQDPELIGIVSSDVRIQAVQQTGETSTTPQGNLAAQGTIQVRGRAFTKSFTEHGIIMGLMSIRTDQMYQQGIPRIASYSTRYDFFWPEFAHLGEQAILNKEIYAQGTSADDDVFGYQERWNELRYKESIVTGHYRSNSPTSLDSWHLAQDFASLPVLNETFVNQDTPYDRVVAVTSEPDFNGQVWFDYKCTRPMPVRSIPSLSTRI